jgi:cell wall-associated protease
MNSLGSNANCVLIVYLGDLMSIRNLSIFLLAVPLALAACSKETPKLRPLDKFDRKVKEAFRDSGPAPAAEVGNWFLKSPELDGLEGVAADRAYAELKLGAGKTIIVAVIDSGVDIKHEDLQGKIWTNPGEIPDNRIDDDGNGYIDDVHGWNFLGGYDADHKPLNIGSETLEMTRELKKMKAKQKSGPLTPEQQAYLTELSGKVESQRADAQAELAATQPVVDAMKAQYDVLAPALGLKFEEVTLASVESLKSADSQIVAAKEKLSTLFKENGVVATARLLARLENGKATLEKYLNEDFDPRKEIVGDDPENYADHAYGNNDVTANGADHGTHVSGLIAASRGNGIGMDGVATNVLIMPVRAVPDGDERDKDIANAVRYAVDNGAQVINMSFGKAYSPGKSVVDEAFLYAESKGVLIFHAAGNDNADNDLGGNFPNKHIAKNPGQKVRTWIEVGASSALKGENLPAPFSNYGQKDVDLFSPGLRVNSTTPNNTYSVFSGTSMASPVAAGVAALVMSQKPDLSPLALRSAILTSVRKYDGLVVRLPGSDPIQAVLFSRLSLTGGVIDAYITLKKLLANP